MGNFKFFGKNEDAFERIFDEAERLEAELAREREAMLHQTFPLADGELPNPIPLLDED